MAERRGAGAAGPPFGGRLRERIMDWATRDVMDIIETHGAEALSKLLNAVKASLPEAREAVGATRETLIAAIKEVTKDVPPALMNEVLVMIMEWA